ncbi:MAG TPA: M20 family metallopeptidase [Clostridia bacterium]|mgnify:FL=1|nr:M20 family metallopeptidase [Clostridia bacterium]
MITGEQMHGIVQERRDDILKCLSESIRIPSEQTYNRDDATDGLCGKVYVQWLKAFGFEPIEIGVNENRLNVLCDWKGTREGPTFLFNGHLDTHPRPPVEGEHGLFSGDVADGYVFGVGAANMKSGNTCALFAMGLLKELGFDPKGTVNLSLVVDEQNGGIKGANWLLDRGYLKGDFGISMDVSDKKLGVEIGGIADYKITYRSQPAPSHRKHPNTDALTKAFRAINAILKFREEFIKPAPHSKLIPNMTVSSLHAGHAANTYADVATFTLDCRIIPPKTTKSVEAELVAILDGFKDQYESMDYEMIRLFDKPPMVVPEDCAIVKACDEAYGEMFDKPLERGRHMGGQDAEHIYARYGTQMPILSPSLFDSIAQPDERVSIQDMLDTTELYMRILVKMMG